MRGTAMQYLLMLYSRESGWAELTPEQQQERRVPYLAYMEALKKAGAYLGSNRLQSIAKASTVRIANGKTQVLDGPYADTKEQCGGYVLIDVPDLDSSDLNRLQSIAKASTVRIANGKTQVLDGPYADTKEQCGGYVLIDVPDLDS